MNARLKNWREEKRSAYLYRILADGEAGTPRRGLFLDLADEAENQAALWQQVLGNEGGTAPAPYRPELRTRIVAALVRRLGARPLRGVLAAMKVRGMSLYSKGLPGHSMPVSLADVGRRHKGIGAGGNLRAAVFGVNDGLVSNASLILGVAGATAEPRTIFLSGAAGLLAGAFSMAAGEYVSVRSQREMYEYQIGLERQELDQYPAEEAAELALIYEARGLPREDAERLARGILTDPEKALDALAREELGLDPDELGSPWGAAIFSLVSFAAGGLIPLLPFIFGRTGLGAVVLLTGVALFAVGATLSLFTGRHAVLGGARMLLVGGMAGALTYGIGKVLGVSVG